MHGGCEVWVEKAQSPQCDCDMQRASDCTQYYTTQPWCSSLPAQAAGLAMLVVPSESAKEKKTAADCGFDWQAKSSSVSADPRVEPWSLAHQPNLYAAETACPGVQ